MSAADAGHRAAPGGQGLRAKRFLLTSGVLLLVFRIRAVVAAQWFLGGLIEFTLYGIIASRLYPPRGR